MLYFASLENPVIPNPTADWKNLPEQNDGRASTLPASRVRASRTSKYNRLNCSLDLLVADRVQSLAKKIQRTAQ